jgi:hypothetical protein
MPDAPLDRHGRPRPGRPDVAAAPEPEEQGDEHGPLAHGGSMRGLREDAQRGKEGTPRRIAGGTMRRRGALGEGERRPVPLR